MSQSLLEVENLVRHYERPKAGFFSRKPLIKALSGVSFSVQKGESFGVVGESGAGKSTLARTILTLEEPTSGEVRFRGENLFELPPDRKLSLRRHVQMVFQDPFATLDPKHKVLAVVSEPLALVDDVSSSERKARVEETLADVGLDSGDLDKYPHEFSGGQRQRIAIARALITRPDLIVADEPVSALDGAMRTQILDLMMDLQERFRLTYIVISRDPSVIRDVTDRFAVMKSGTIVEQGDTGRIFDSPAHDYTKSFLNAALDPSSEDEEDDDDLPSLFRAKGEDDGMSKPNGRYREKTPVDDGEDASGKDSGGKDEAGEDQVGADAESRGEEDDAPPAAEPAETPTTADPPPAAPPPPSMPRGIDAAAAIKAADVAIANAIASARRRSAGSLGTAASVEEPEADQPLDEPVAERETPPEPAETDDDLQAEMPADEPREEAEASSGDVPSDAVDAEEPPAPVVSEPPPVPAAPIPPPETPQPAMAVSSGTTAEAPAPTPVVPEETGMVQGQNLIGGAWRDASDDRLLKVIDPSDGQGFGYVARGTAVDIDHAVAAARRTVEGPWGRMPAFERGRLLAKLAELVLQTVDHLALLEARDVGKPLRQARADAVALARYFEFYGGAADKIHGQTIPYHDGHTVLTLREPHGVTGHIVPWNYPMQIIGRSVGAALAMGNACVLKPGEDASLTALEIGRLALEAGLPPGVLNIVTGLGEEAGAALAAHPGIDHLSFTGSVATGESVQRAAAAHSCPVTLELGGKSPQIVFADADLDQALPILVRAAIQNAGQTCSAGSRVLVQDWIYDELTHRLAERFDQLDVGPARRDLDCGPVINPIQQQRIETYLERARSDRIAVLGEGEIAPDTPDGGYYVKPVLLGDVPADHPLAQEEIFGPVLSAIRFSDEDDAIRIANDNAYGLVAGVWTRDGARQMRLARTLRAGQVFVNSYGAGGGVELPFGGVKSSGFGREKGFEALYGFSTLKTVTLRHG